MRFLIKVLDLTLRYRDLYNEQMLRGYFVEGIDLSSQRTMRRWWADINEAPLEDLSHKDQSFHINKEEIRKPPKRMVSVPKWCVTTARASKGDENYTTL